MNTAAKRHSAVNWNVPWRTMPFPDGAIGQGDRQHVAYMYSGIAAGVLVTNIVAGLQFSFIPDRFDFSAPPNTQDFTAGDD